MSRDTLLRSIFVSLIIVLGNLQAWNSHAFSASLWIVLLVSLAIAVPAVALLTPLRPALSIGNCTRAHPVDDCQADFSESLAGIISCPCPICHEVDIYWHRRREVR